MLGDGVVKVANVNLYLNIPTINQISETQTMFNEAIEKKFTLSFESWTIDSKPFNTSKEFQLNILSSANINSPIHLLAVCQKTQPNDSASTTHPPADLSNERCKNAFFDNFSFKKHFVDIDGSRYPKDPNSNTYTAKTSLNQYSDLKSFTKNMLVNTYCVRLKHMVKPKHVILYK